MANLKQIKPTLLASGVNRTHPALYQVLNQIIDFAQGSLDEISSRLQLLVSGSGGSSGGSFAPTNGSYLTITDEHVNLPNSRELLAGTGITFDDTIAYQRTINSANGGIDYVVASDGATPVPSPLNDGFGNFIYIAYTP